jgi:hypothetical protein
LRIGQFLRAACAIPGRSFGVVRFVIADLGLIWAGLATARMVKAGGRTLGVVSVTDLGRADAGLTAARTGHLDPGLLDGIAGCGSSAAGAPVSLLTHGSIFQSRFRRRS